jgi:hypothetical protein
MRVRHTDLERTLNLMRLLEGGGSRSRVGRVVSMLGDCFPSGTRRDELGVTYRQMLYLLALAGFDREEALLFHRAVQAAGGMDSNQAHHLINRLKRSGTSGP